MGKERIALAVTALAALAGCGPMAYKITPMPVTQKLVETTIQTDKGLFLPKVAIIDIDGMLANARGKGLLTASENPTALVVEKLKKAAADRMVKAVVLRINSPGGTVTASDIIYREVQRVREGADDRPGKPVVAMMLDLGASGAYYVSCGADEIVAEPTCVTGSIGVVMMTFEAAQLLDKIGVRTDAIKSGPKKDAGSPFRHMAPGERKIFQTLIDEYYENFLAVVLKGRTQLDEKQLRVLADGRIYSGRQALEHKLVDHVGGLDDAIGRAKELAKIKAARAVMYDRPAGYRGTVYSSAPRGSMNVFNVNTPDLLRSHGFFMYLWQP